MDKALKGGKKDTETWIKDLDYPVKLFYSQQMKTDSLNEMRHIRLMLEFKNLDQWSLLQSESSSV